MLDISAAGTGGGPVTQRVRTLSGGGAIALGANRLETVLGADSTFGGVISGTGGLSLSGGDA